MADAGERLGTGHLGMTRDIVDSMPLSTLR